VLFRHRLFNAENPSTPLSALTLLGTLFLWLFPEQVLRDGTNIKEIL
jgi:hypothetical protein